MVCDGDPLSFQLKLFHACRYKVVMFFLFFYILVAAKTYRKKVQEKCREKVKLLHFSCTFVSASWSKKSAGKVHEKG